MRRSFPPIQNNWENYHCVYFNSSTTYQVQKHWCHITYGHWTLNDAIAMTGVRIASSNAYNKLGAAFRNSHLMVNRLFNFTVEHVRMAGDRHVFTIPTYWPKMLIWWYFSFLKMHKSTLNSGNRGTRKCTRNLFQQLKAEAHFCHYTALHNSTVKPGKVWNQEELQAIHISTHNATHICLLELYSFCILFTATNLNFIPTVLSSSLLPYMLRVNC